MTAPTREAWTLQLRRSREAAVLAIRAAELDGADGPLSLTKLAADLVEPARSKAYNELGDGRRSDAIATAWLRTWIGPQGGETVADLDPTL